MQTSRNPKVLNNALKYKLQPILDKIEDLETMSKNYQESMADQKSQETALKSHANDQFSLYETNREKLISNIDTSKSNLTKLIENQLYNPNKATSGSESSESTEVEETKLLTDKIVKTAAYGFVKDGVDMCMFGLTGKGLAIGTDPGQDLEYDWRTPENDDHPFASYYVNDILFVDTNTAFIATNNGVVIYKFDTDSYMVYDTTHGLPSKEIIAIRKVTNKSETSTGYVCITSSGVAYSPTGERWTTVDTSFTATSVCLSTTNFIDTPQKTIFIGTTNGIYCLDASELIDNNVRSVVFMAGCTNFLPNNYVYGLAYNETTDVLAAATTGGALIIKNASKYAKGTNSVESANTVQLTNKNGLIGTSCYDMMYTVDDKLIIGTANGLSITSNYAAFTSISRTKNAYNDGKILNSHICNRIIRKNKELYTIIHGIGLTEDVTI